MSGMLNTTIADWSCGGMPLLPFCAFEGEGDGNGGTNGNQNGNNGQGQQGQQGQQGENGNGASGNGNGGGQQSLDAANAEAAQRRHQNAQLAEQLAAAKAKLDEFEAKERTELENAQKERDEAKAERDRLDDDAKNLRIQNAFLSNNKHDWHNASDALRMADLAGVTIKDGKVDGLDAALDKLAKDSPYLLKTAPSGDGNGGSGNGGSGSGNGGQGNGSGGTPTGPGGTPPAGQGGGRFSREEMEKKYPVLRGRGGD